MNRQATISRRIGELDWESLHGELDGRGFARVPALLAAAECDALAGLYESGRFRKRVDMGRHRYGEGEYRYFEAPLPPAVAELREALYSRLAPVANRWEEVLAGAERYPPALDAFLALCREHAQTRPTPLLLRYEAGGFNCLHQDVYGAVAFPLQVVIVLSQLGTDFTGGEFLLVEQRPRAQSRGEAIALDQGDALVFPNRYRPVAGSRGFHRNFVRHGVSTLQSGRRISLGIIFHDAE
jgi:hypothetical protein